MNKTYDSAAQATDKEREDKTSAAGGCEERNAESQSISSARLEFNNILIIKSARYREN